MSHRPCSGRQGLIVLGFLVLAGCASPATTKPQGAAGPAPGSPGAQGAVKEQAAKGAREGKQEAGKSSLEALRRGEKPGTAASSPLQEVYFDYDRSDLRPDARETLKRNAEWLKANPSARVEVEGHCDERGTNEYNLALGAKRAQAAKDYLVSLGIAAGRLSTISYGEEVPVCREQNEGCWQKNRRARFVILPARPAS
ncbi:MAG: peptidoglycan-associated lipoprotein Pal [Deltaproteobacteria bacterium]|nr:peptidoglycan-associated lipoprotein Pal [Deltaproteobacteria bacterium]